MEQLVSHPIIFFVVSFVLMSLGAWVGAVFLRRDKPLDEDIREDFGVVRAATLTLLAIIIGFTLSMAVGRYDQRKNYEEEEANAIGTEFIRADLLSSPDAANIRSLLTKYLDQRILFYQVRDPQRLREINSTTAELQTELWMAVRTAATARPNPLTALAVSGMNDVINSQGYTQAVWWNRIPLAAWLLMTVVALFCNLLVGYGASSKVSRGPFLLIMPLTVALSFLLVADIDSPRGGIIRVLPQNLINVAQSLPRP